MSEKTITVPLGGLRTLTPACPAWCEIPGHEFEHDDVIDLSRRKHTAQLDTLWWQPADPDDEPIPLFCVDLVMDECVRGRELWFHGPRVNAYPTITLKKTWFNAADLRKIGAMLLNAANKLDEIAGRR